MENNSLIRWIFLKTNDHVIFKVRMESACMSELIRDMLENSEDDNDEVIPLPHVQSHVLERIIQYTDYHWNNPAAPINKPLKGFVEPELGDWDRHFLQTLDCQLLVDILMAASYLDIKDLFDLCCAKIASDLSEKSPEQVRDIFGISNQFTPEEEERIVKENTLSLE